MQQSNSRKNNIKNLEFGEEIENRLIDIIEQLVPKEINYLLRYFYNDKTDIGLSVNIREKLEEIIRYDAPEMNADELAITYSSMSLSKVGTPDLLEYLEDRIILSQPKFTLDSIIHLLH